MSAIPVPDPTIRRQRVILQGRRAEPGQPTDRLPVPSPLPAAREARLTGDLRRRVPPLLRASGDHLVACHFRGPGAAATPATHGALTSPNDVQAERQAAPETTASRPPRRSRSSVSRKPACGIGTSVASSIELAVLERGRRLEDRLGGLAGLGEHRERRRRRPAPDRVPRHVGDPDVGLQRLLGEVTRGRLVAGEDPERRIDRPALLGLAEPLVQPAARVEPAARRRVDRARHVALEDRPACACARRPDPAPGRPRAGRACTGGPAPRTARRAGRSRRSCRGTSPRRGR